MNLPTELLSCWCFLSSFFFSYGLAFPVSCLSNPVSFFTVYEGLSACNKNFVCVCLSLLAALQARA